MGMGVMGGDGRRQLVTIRLRRLYDLAKDTGQLERVIIFGSYITSKPNPNDVDVVLIFNDDFDLNSCNQETRMLLDHRLAADEFKASVFWVRPAMLFLETLEEFIAHWQIKRDKTLRGIVEVRVLFATTND
jgi:predicted nucleotidyltransferase